MNPFDLVVGLALIVSAITGFRAGLLRSLAAILGYVSAMPIAVAAATRFSPTAGSTSPPWASSSVLFFLVFLGTGLVIGALLRVAVNDLFGPSVNVADRIAGSLFGVARIALVALIIVIAFDRLIPADQQPPFLLGSKFRPLLSRAGQLGLTRLPPEMASYIDQLKKERGI